MSIFILTIPVFAATTNSKSLKWVFIGDSYSVFGKTTCVPNLVAKKFKLKQKEYKKFCKIGYGFKAIYRGKSARFISLIENAAVNENVKNVVVIGGIGNDLRTGTPVNELTEAMDELYTKVKELYPNAAIWYAMPNWAPVDSTQKGKEAKEWQNMLKDRESLYLENATANGVHVLKKTRTVLRFSNNRKYFLSDYRHPSLKGRNLIANAIYKDISKSKIYKQQKN